MSVRSHSFSAAAEEKLADGVSITRDVIHLPVYEGEVGYTQSQHAGLGPEVTVFYAVMLVALSTEPGLAGIPLHFEPPARWHTGTCIHIQKDPPVQNDNSYMTQWNLPIHSSEIEGLKNCEGHSVRSDQDTIILHIPPSHKKLKYLLMIAYTDLHSVMTSCDDF